MGHVLNGVLWLKFNRRSGEKREIRESWRIQRKFHVGTQTSVETYKDGRN